MERKDIESIGDVLRRAIEESCLDARLAEVRAEKLWQQIAGAPVADLCGTPVVRKGVMRVPVRSASLRNELSMHRSVFISQINKTLGREVITEMKFVGD